MPDLSTKAVREFWRGSDPRLAETLLAMESIESRLQWTLDGDVKVEALLNQLGQNLEGAIREDTILAERENLVFIMAYLHSGRAVRIMQWLDERYDGIAFRLMETMANGARDGQFDSTVMLDRITMLRRIKHIARVFSTSKIVLVLRLLEQLEAEKGHH